MDRKRQRKQIKQDRCEYPIRNI